MRIWSVSIFGFDYRIERLEGPSAQLSKRTNTNTSQHPGVASSLLTLRLVFCGYYLMKLPVEDFSKGSELGQKPKKPRTNDPTDRERIKAVVCLPV